MSSILSIEKIEAIPVCTVAEGPHWDAETQSLYFVDIVGKSIHKYVPATKRHTKVVIGTNYVSFVIPIRGERDKFLISVGRELVVVTWDGESEKVSNLEKIVEVENHPETINNTWNDAKCDRTGRLWSGTNSEARNGAVYMLQNKEAIKKIDNIGVSNGLAWNSDDTKMYYIDSVTGCIISYDFNIENGVIGNKQVIFTPAKHNMQGDPDGMAMDKDGNIWVAIFNGQLVVKIDPRTPETVLATIAMPAKQVTSVAFGGPNLDELYVTSARIFGLENSPKENGSVYKITGVNTKGYPGISVVL